MDDDGAIGENTVHIHGEEADGGPGGFGNFSFGRHDR
jgi:hypothetical protein